MNHVIIQHAEKLTVYFTALILIYQIFRRSFITHPALHTTITKFFPFLITTFKIQLAQAHMLRDKRITRK